MIMFIYCGMLFSDIILLCMLLAQCTQQGTLVLVQDPLVVVVGGCSSKSF
jgi:hypothetical protein